jgi:hypothetical protein
MVAAAAIAFFFWESWRKTGDRLFVLFAAAFAVFAVNRVLLLILNDDDETWVYLSRAFAFGLIIAAIVDKNRAASR